MAWKSGSNWRVDIDEEKNRLYLELDGHLDTTEAAAAADATIAGAKQLEAGFDMINDISAYQPGDPESIQEIERGKEGIVEHGVEAVVRVMADSTTGQMQFDRVGEDKESYQLAMADTFEEAEQLLDRRRQQAE